MENFAEPGRRRDKRQDCQVATTLGDGERGEGGLMKEGRKLASNGTGSGKRRAFYITDTSEVGLTVDLIWRSWVRFPPRSKTFYLYLVWFSDSLY